MAAATVLTDAGKAIIANRMIGAGTEPKYVAMGTGGGSRTAAAADTALTTEVETRTAGTGTRVTTTVTNDTHQEVGTVTATGSRTVNEAALFDASSAGNMYISATHADNGLSSGDSLQYTFKNKFA